MNRLVILTFFTLWLALATATVFAIWPVVGDAPWLESGPRSLAPSERSILSPSTVRDAVRSHVTFWCRDRYPTEKRQDQCIEDAIGRACEDDEAWLSEYHPARHVWEVSCGGWQYLVDDTTGDVSSPQIPGLSGIGRVEQRLSRMESRVRGVTSHVDDVEGRVDDLEWRVEDLE